MKNNSWVDVRIQCEEGLHKKVSNTKYRFEKKKRKNQVDLRPTEFSIIKKSVNFVGGKDEKK